MATSITDFLIRVRVQGQQLIDKLTKSTNNAEKSVNKTANAIKNLGDTLTNAAGGGNQFTDMLSNGLGRMGPYGAALGAAAGAFALLGMKAVNAADAIQDISDATGISAGRLLNFKESILNAGGKTEDFEKVALKLTQTLGDAAEGNEKVRKSFRDLGINLGDANGKLRSTDELLPEIVKALSEIESPAERSAKAVELLGKSAARIDWTQVSAINDPFKDAQIAQLAKYQAAIDRIAHSIETNLITAFGRLAIAIEQDDITGELDIWLAKFQSFVLKMAGISKSANDILLEQKRRREAFGLEATTSKGQMPLLEGVMPSQAGAGRGKYGGPNASELAATQRQAITSELSITDEGKKQIANAQAQTKLMKAMNGIQSEYQQKLNDSLGMQQLLGDITRSNLQIDRDRDTQLANINRQIEIEIANKERDQRVTNAIVGELRAQALEITRNADLMKAAKQDEINKLQQQRNLMSDIVLMNQQMSQNLQLSQLKNQNDLIGVFGDELRLKQGLMSIENERAITALNAQNKLRALGKNATAEDIARTNKEIQNAKMAADTKIQILKDQLDKEKALREDAAAGAKQALEQIARSVDPFTIAQQKVNSLFGSMNDALDNFVETGKINFGDFASSIIKDLIKIELKASATRLMSMAFGKGGFLSSLMGFADGGNPPVNKPSIVGEQGPELFIPRTAGTIIPNNQLGKSNGAQAQPVYNIVNNISAVDAKSVAQLFAENRQVLLGSVKMAEKELPYRVR